jgi:hypothetical protein
VKIADRAMPALEVTMPASSGVVLLFDPVTALLAHMRYDAPADGGQHVKAEESFSDYRDVKGLKVAYRVSVSRDGVTFVERTLRSFAYNEPVNPALFVKPS